MIARAFSPGHITGFFQIHDEPEDPLKKGSRGAGVSLSQGVTTEVQITTANSMKIDIRINGQPVKSALVSEKVVSRFLDFSSGKKYQVKVSHEVGLPIGCGFGTSGAGALSLSLALNEALDIQISRIEAAQIAHIVEVESQTGLGTVIAETTGGVEIRVRPGAPGVGEILNLPISKDHVVACLTLGPIPTPSYLQDSQIRRRINEKGGFFTNALQNNPTITNFLTYSRQFAEHIRIPTKRVKSVFQDADAAGIICSTAIFGENVFTVIPSDQIQEIKAIFNRFEDSKHLSSIMEIDHRGARLLNEYQEVSPKHPRAESLRIRAALTRGFEMGVTSAFGLFAHGRGEAFDYLLGEQTTENAKKAIRVAAAAFLLAQHPVISVNGNVVALVPHELIHLSQVTKAKLEINLYHRSRTREKAIAKMLKEAGAKEILGINPKTQKIIQEVHSDRRVVDKRGLLIADMAFIPLEDGDRTEGLVRLDKKVITIDLNPLSRTAQLATITIVDNVVRALPLLVNYVKELRNENKEALQKIVNTFNNRANLSEAINLIKERLKNLAESNGIRCNGGTR